MNTETLKLLRQALKDLTMAWSLEEIAEMNIEKLRARYPDGFEAERSLHRKKGDI